MREKILIFSTLLLACLPFDPMGSITLTEITNTRGEIVTDSRGDESSSVPTSNITEIDVTTSHLKNDLGNLPTTSLDLTSSSTSEIDSPTTTTIDDSSTSESSSVANTTGDSSICGNGIVEGDEQCDGDNLNGFTCWDLGYTEARDLKCNEICTFDVSGCFTCGNCILDPDEECDPCLYPASDGSYCEKEPTDFGSCVIKFTKPVLYAHVSINNNQINTPELDKEEADIFCKIYNRDLTAESSSWNQDITAWPNNYNYFHHFTLGLDEAILLKSTNSLLGDYKLYYIEHQYLNPNLGPGLKFQFMCQI